MAKQAATRTKSTPAPRKKAVSDIQELTPRGPSYEQISQRAFELYLARGGQNGDALSDWLRAEAELSQQAL